MLDILFEVCCVSSRWVGHELQALMKSCHDVSVVSCRCGLA